MENVQLVGEKGTFDSIVKSKYFIQAVKFWVAHLNVTVNPRVFVIILWPLEGGGSSMADTENHLRRDQ
jgi:hypothetical protein